MTSISIPNETMGVCIAKDVPHPDTMTFTDPQALEIRVLWNGNLQDVVHARIDGEDAFTYTVGEDPGADFIVGSDRLGAKTAFELARAEDGVISVSAPTGASVIVQKPDGTTAELRDTGERFTYRGLDLGGQVCIGLGSIQFELKPVREQSKFSARAAVDWETGYFFGFSALLHAIFFLIIGLVPPDASGLSFDNLEDLSRIQQVMLGVEEMERPPLPKFLEEPAPNTGESAKHAGLEGQAGDRKAKKTGAKLKIKGPRDNPRPTIGRDRLKEMVKSIGVVGALDRYSGPVSPFGSLNPLGTDPENALAEINGDPNISGNSFGWGGLGIRGTGRGGGGDALDTIGDDTFGKNFRSGPTGPAIKDLRNRERPRGIKTGKAVLIGDTIPKHVIRREIRSRLNEVRHCYEKGLLRHPDISGRVSVQFQISGMGQVMQSMVADSTVGDAEVGMCIASVIKRISFPAPSNGGVVIVTYPFTLASSGGM